MIEDVVINYLETHHDERGFLERSGDLLKKNLDLNLVKVKVSLVIVS